MKEARRIFLPLCSEYNFKNTIYNYGWHNAKYQILYLNQWHWVKLFQIMNSNAVFWTPTGKLKNRSCYANFTRQRLSITWQIITLLSLIIDKLFIHCNYLFVKKNMCTVNDNIIHGQDGNDYHQYKAKKQFNWQSSQSYRNEKIISIF